MKKFTITLLALSFFAINIATAQTTEKKQAIQKVEKKAILKKVELQKISKVIEVKAQTNEAESISSEKLVFTDVKDYEKCRISYPDFPEYIKTDNEKKDLENFNKAVNEWANNNPAEFKKIIIEQNESQKTKNKKYAN